MPSDWASLIEIGESVIHVHQYSNGPVIPDTKTKQWQNELVNVEPRKTSKISKAYSS